MTDNTVDATFEPDARLKQIADRLREGQTIEPITIRELLSWFGAKRRTAGTVRAIKGSLYDNDLSADADFQYLYLHYPIRFRLGRDERDRYYSTSTLLEELGLAEESPPSAEIVSFPGVETASDTRPITNDPTYRIGKLDSANNAPISVKPNDTLANAITIMLANDFSQLPVMTSERDVKGVISWASIGTRVAIGRTCKEVRECMDEAHIISEDTSLFDAIQSIVKYQYVLIQNSFRKISGIVTASDLSIKFLELTEPFLLLEELEKHIRFLITRSGFTGQQLTKAADRDIKSVFDLSFGDYVRILENPQCWSQLQLSIDRGAFVKMLDDVREIRNDVMHFNPDTPSAGYLDPVRRLTTLLQKLHRAWASGSNARL